MDLIRNFRDRLDEINREIERILTLKEPKKLYLATRHLPLAGGKRLRPLLSLFSCEAVGGDWKDAIPFSVSLELMHNFTLVHDDIIDRSVLRRGIETVHVKFGENTAILAGDVLFAKSYEALHYLNIDSDTFRKLSFLLTKCIEEICEGQQMDIEFENKKYVSEEEYMNMINKKTAALFSYSAEGGAMIGKGKREYTDSLSKYGRYLGLAFQIWDDYLDLRGNEKEFGKKIGNDIKEGKKTLMIIHALENCDSRDREFILSVLGKENIDEEKIRKVIELLDNIGSLEYSRRKALEFSKKAKECLDILPESEAKRVLEKLVDYSVSRRR